MTTPDIRLEREQIETGILMFLKEVRGVRFAQVAGVRFPVYDEGGRPGAVIALRPDATPAPPTEPDRAPAVTPDVLKQTMGRYAVALGGLIQAGDGKSALALAAMAVTACELLCAQLDRKPPGTIDRELESYARNLVRIARKAAAGLPKPSAGPTPFKLIT